MAVDGRALTESLDLPDVIGPKAPGSKVRLTVLHGSARRIVTVTLAPRPNKPLSQAPGP